MSEMSKHEKRFWAKVNKTDGCWVWTGCKNRGYGQFWTGTGKMLAHRYSYELLRKIPEGLTLDHLCKNPPCVRPDHLEAVTMKENILRSESACALHARKKTCPKGHPLDDRRKAGRFCRTCKRADDARNRRENPGRKVQDLEADRRYRLRKRYAASLTKCGNCEKIEGHYIGGKANCGCNCTPFCAALSKPSKGEAKKPCCQYHQNNPDHAVACTPSRAPAPKPCEECGGSGVIEDGVGENRAIISCPNGCAPSPKDGQEAQ